MIFIVTDDIYWKSKNFLGSTETKLFPIDQTAIVKFSERFWCGLIFNRGVRNKKEVGRRKKKMAS